MAPLTAEQEAVVAAWLAMTQHAWICQHCRIVSRDFDHALNRLRDENLARLIGRNFCPEMDRLSVRLGEAIQAMGLVVEADETAQAVGEWVLAKYPEGLR